MAYLVNGRNNAPTIFDIFNRPLSDFDFADGSSHGKSFLVDVRDMGDSYILEADLPGARKEDIHLNFEEGILTISASHHVSGGEEGQENGSYLIRERTEGEYQRSFRFQDADPEQISASFEQAKLTVILKKQQAQKGRRITIA